MKKHILLVDDDVLIVGALEEHLKSQGYQVTVAESCAEGREALRQKSHIDLMILDHMLPDGRGTDLLESIAENNTLQRPPVIMSSALANTQNPSWEVLLHRLPAFSQNLIQAYVPKPYSFDNMDTVVDLIFSVVPPAPSAKTIVTGDYKHPPKKPHRA
jgi:DNA-binding response OmpR family regulator